MPFDSCLSPQFKAIALCGTQGVQGWGCPGSCGGAAVGVSVGAGVCYMIGLSTSVGLRDDSAVLSLQGDRTLCSADPGSETK